MSIKELAATESEIVSRYLVHRYGGMLGGAKHQILTVKSLTIELCNATEKEENREIYKLSEIVKIIPVPGTTTDFYFKAGKPQTVNLVFSCSKRSDLIDDYLRVVDHYLYYTKQESSAIERFKSYVSKIRLNNDSSDKYINVSVTAFRTFLCIKREGVSAETEKEASLFKSLTGEAYFSDKIEVYYSNIGCFLPRPDGIDIYYSSSEICISLEMREVKVKQEFIELVTNTARNYAGITLRKTPTDSIKGNNIRSSFKAKTKDRCISVFKTHKVRSFGCVHEVEIALTEEYLFEIKDDVIANRVNYRNLRDVLFLDSYSYPLIKLNFPDQSSLVYAFEYSKVMNFISQINAVVGKLRSSEPATDSDRIKSNILFLQSTDIPRTLMIRGKAEDAKVNNDLYMNLVEGFYNNTSNEEKALNSMHRILVNYISNTSNSKFQLKLFYLLCAKIVQLYNKLRDAGVRKFFQKKLLKFRETSENLFPTLAKKGNLSPTAADKKDAIPFKEETSPSNIEEPKSGEMGDKTTSVEREKEQEFFV